MKKEESVIYGVESQVNIIESYPLIMHVEAISNFQSHLLFTMRCFDISVSHKELQLTPFHQITSHSGRKSALNLNKHIFPQKSNFKMEGANHL